MSRLDRHVALVQNKLAMQRFVDALGRVLPLAATVALATWLVEKQTTLALHQKLWWLGGATASLVVAIVYAIWRRPNSHDAAVAIDERLGLKEKFSTALAVRNMNDPFAMAAVRDAEHTADNVSLHKRFPLATPAVADWKVWMLLAVVGLTAWLLPADAFGHKAEVKKKNEILAQQAIAKKSIDTAITKVEMIAQKFPNAEGIAAAKAELEKLKTAKIDDAGRNNRSAAQILNNLEKSLKNDIAKSEQVAKDAQNQKLLKGLAPDADDKGPVAEAHKALAQGDVKQAMSKLNDAAKKFDKMSDEEKKKAAQQMAKLADQLKQQANNPQQQQAAAQQIAQQLGVNQQQAQQMAQQMQAAAAGDKQAQQQLQQQAQQAMQQMNGGNGPTPQQQQALQQMMQGLQAQANGQMTAQQMANAAQNMAQAMQQAQQAGNQNANGQNNNQNQGQAGNNQQQMAQAADAMKDQLQQMEAVANDAQQQAAAQDAAQQAAQDAAGQCNNPGAGQGNGQPGNNNGQVGGGKNGQWAQGDPNGKKGNGQGGPGQAAGGGIGKEEAPYDIKKEHAPVQNNENGKFIASQFVKAGALKGESLAQLQQVTASAEHTDTDDVDADHVSGEAKSAVKGYFGQLSGEQAK